MSVEFRTDIQHFRRGPKSIWIAAGVGVFSFYQRIKEMFFFILIVLGVYVKKRRSSRRVIIPLIYQEISKCGLTPLPIILFLSCVIGFLVVGQSAIFLGLIGDASSSLIGNILVLVIFKEIGPLLAALVLLVRVGVSTVVELAGERASGQVEWLCSLGIDPVHYYVVPRAIGMGVATLCLTIYLITFAFISGYAVVFFMDIPWKPMEYLDQIVAALKWKDFLILFLKAMLFGSLIAITTCYESLAHPVLSHQIPATIIRVVIGCLIGWGIIDVLFYFI
ncbi:MAG: MlaE family ABC transporter permease [Limisphaerales bacterium]|jgi:phospholipid/cholesterol/gamma-HCH transport system permease protein|nr:ABC transporter permease [Verrucomicrobiota bacterium]